MPGNIDILLSNNNGTSFDYTLAEDTADDGSEEITVPTGSLSAECLIRVVEHNGTISDESDAVFAIVPLAPPYLASPDNGATGVWVWTLEWNPINGIESYTYDVDIASDAEFAEIVDSVAGTSEATFRLSELEYDTEYFWRARAHSPGSDSEWSGTYSFTTTTGQVAYNWDKTIGSGPFGDCEYGPKETGWCVACNNAGDVYTIGKFASGYDENFDGVDFGGGMINLNGNQPDDGRRCDTFLLKNGSDGAYGWTKVFGCTGCDDLEVDEPTGGVAVDGSGNVFIAGAFCDTATFAGGDPQDSTGDNDIFLTRINADGSYGWTNTYGGTSEDVARAIALDNDGNIFIAGYFNGTVNFGEGDVTSEGSKDIFVTKVTNSGDYCWTKTFGGTGYDEAYGVAVDADGNVYVTGYFDNTVDFGDGDRDAVGSYDIFLLKLDTNGAFAFAKTIGGTSSDYGWSVGVDDFGNVYITGTFYNTVDFSGAGDEYTSEGGEDIFLTKIKTDGTYCWTKTIGNDDCCNTACGLGLDANGNVYITGYFGEDPLDFDPGEGEDEHETNGGRDIFVTKIDAYGNYGWTKTAGGSEGCEEGGRSVTIDADGNVYVTGTYKNTVDFGGGVHGANHGNDIFLVKYSRDD